ncbi:MAG: 1-acyl-sn-glycerol-3-phosphate acyltransferase [Clostridiaceae bacterium]|nr:1-acyl-sn-glycerol-3-phosphate acyltransferase [Clostridiaceae bacterium]
MKEEKTKGRVKKPNPILYYGAVSLFKLYYRLFYHHRVNKSDMGGIKPPYLVVAGHSCWLDYIISSTSMFPVRMNYVGAYNFFRSRLLKVVFNFMGVIPRHQFTSDITSVRKMKYCIDKGRAVALFPHGCLSNEGRPGGFAGIGVAKLIKLLNVPVVAVKTDGGYLTRPRWTKTSRYGRLETTVKPILTVDEIKDLSNKEIYQRLINAIDFDDYKWQRERMVTFRGKNVAEGVEYVLYKCPKCQSEFTLRSEKDRLYCLDCGNAVHMNQYMLFEPETTDTVFFDGIDRWYDFQKSCLDKEIESTTFQLTADTELKFAEPGKYGYQHQGYGVLRLTKDEITYIGKVQDVSTEIRFPMKNIPMVPYAANEYIEVAVREDIYRFVLEDRRQMMKWVMAVGLIRDKYYKEES